MKLLVLSSSFILQAYEEFVATFDETPAQKGGKVWVKAGTFDAGSRSKYHNVYCMHCILVIIV